MLNVNGRILADLLLYKLNANFSFSGRQLTLNEESRFTYGSGGRSDDQLLMECDANLAIPIAKTLFAFKMRKDIKIELCREYDLWAIYPRTEKEEIRTYLREMFKQIVSEDLIVVKDPRLSSLGYRFLSRLRSKTIEAVQCFTKYLSDCSLVESSLSNYREYRYKLGVAEGLRDFGHAQYNLFESNAHCLNASSFTKGLYVGEKMISRLGRSKYQRRMRPIELPENSVHYVYPGATLSRPEKENETELGKIVCVQGRHGIALLQTKHREGDCQLLHVESGTIVNSRIPSWWNNEVNHLYLQNQVSNSEVFYFNSL